jgi:hypothetical protein
MTGDGTASIHSFFSPRKGKAPEVVDEEKEWEQSSASRPLSIDRDGLLAHLNASVAASTSSPLQALEWRSSSHYSSSPVDRAGEVWSIGRGTVGKAGTQAGGSGSHGGLQRRPPAKARTKTRNEMLKERRNDEEKRSMGGGLLQWVATAVTVSATSCSAAAPIDEGPARG